MHGDSGTAGTERFPVRTGSQLLRALRSTNVCIFHPLNRDGDLLTQQLQRIGCDARCFWPPLDQPVPGSDLVFVGLYPDTISHEFSWCDAHDAPPVVAVVNYESPTIIDAVLRIGAKAVVAAPVRSFGVLSALVLAQQISSDLGSLKKRVRRLETKIEGSRKTAEAQEILMRQRGIGMSEAYRAMRAQAMTRRVPIEEIASAIIAAEGVLSLRG